MRDDQRRRRSQYDRGTSLAAQEEFDYDPFAYPSCKPSHLQPRLVSDI